MEKRMRLLKFATIRKDCYGSMKGSSQFSVLSLETYRTVGVGVSFRLVRLLRSCYFCVGKSAWLAQEFFCRFCVDGLGE